MFWFPCQKFYFQNIYFITNWFVISWSIAPIMYCMLQSITRKNNCSPNVDYCMYFWLCEFQYSSKQENMKEILWTKHCTLNKSIKGSWNLKKSQILNPVKASKNIWLARFKKTLHSSFFKNSLLMTIKILKGDGGLNVFIFYLALLKLDSIL